MKQSKRRTCKLHIIGQYFHTSSDTINFCVGSDIDGEGSINCYYNYCPICGIKITEEIIDKQMMK